MCCRWARQRKPDCYALFQQEQPPNMLWGAIKKQVSIFIASWFEEANQSSLDGKDSALNEYLVLMRGEFYSFPILQVFFPHLASNFILSPSRKYSFPISQVILFFPHLAGNELWQRREVPHEPKLHMNFGRGARRLCSSSRTGSWWSDIAAVWIKYTSDPVTSFVSFARAFLHDPVDTKIRNIATLLLIACKRKKMSAIEKHFKLS